jgi:Subtilase family
MANERSVRPKTFYLNERHQLMPGEKRGGGGLPKFGDIDWGAKGQRIGRNLKKLSEKLDASKDPLRGKHYFIMAIPVETVPKRSTAANKPAQFDEPTDYRGKLHAQVFGRLGLDLIDVTADGKAIVHARPDHFQQLLLSSQRLGSAKPREQARWSTIDSFDTVPATERLDFNWVKTLKRDKPVEVLFELQPLLTRLEADLVLRALAPFSRRVSDRILGTGTDLSGRQWARAQMVPDALIDIAQDLSSIQSIHPPLYSIAAVVSGPPTGSPPQPPGSGPPPSAQNLPTVAILDEGVPAGHALLAPFSRSAQVVPRGAQPGHRGDHGSNVASRIVFGEVNDPVAIPAADCRFLDVRVSDVNGAIDTKTVLAGLDATATALPDVRVYNLSINSPVPLTELDRESQKEWHRVLREVDNFSFERDMAVVVAAGNVPAGIVPAPGYPHHVDNPRWGLRILVDRLQHVRLRRIRGPSKPRRSCRP